MSIGKQNTSTVAPDQTGGHQRRIPLKKVETVLLVVFDICAVYFAVILSAWGTPAWAESTASAGAIASIGVMALANVCVFALMHMYSSMWRYASINEVVRIIIATVLGALLGDAMHHFIFNGGFTLREYIMAWCIVLLLCGGVRLLVRALYGSQLWRFNKTAPDQTGQAPRTLVVGAGETGSYPYGILKTGQENQSNLHGLFASSAQKMLAQLNTFTQVNDTITAVELYLVRLFAIIKSALCRISQKVAEAQNEAFFCVGFTTVTKVGC